mgnify:CR=1 FL=1
MQGQQTAGNLYGQAAQASNQDSGLWSALGNVAGQAAGAGKLFGFSDVNLKTDIEPQDPDQALAEVAATPVSKWKYDPAKMAERGIPMEQGMGGQQTGPMAQDVNEEMGENAAPGGKKINLVTMNGKLMASVQALDKKVNKLASMIGAGQIQAGAPA